MTQWLPEFHQQHDVHDGAGSVGLRGAVGTECEACGHDGAMLCNSYRLTSLVVLWFWSRRLSRLCSACARAELLDAQAHTLLLGWWGLPSALFLPIAMCKNARRLLALRHVPPPGPRDVFVVTPYAAPRTGRPLYARPLLWLLIVVVVTYAVAQCLAH